MNNNQTTYVTGPCYRFSLLTSRLIRMEYSDDGLFEDRPTQLAQNRCFGPVEFRMWRTEKGIEIRTEHINLFYDEKPFSSEGLRAENRAPCGGIFTTWHYGDPVRENLGGTARTLDEADGEIPLEAGILSRLCGYSVLDDSCLPVLTEDGWYSGRKEGVKDLYLFCYGTDYRQALKDFFHLCGSTPMLPRFALGNWWSRFYAYTDQAYLSLLDRFREKGIPFSVAVIDMDWHITDAGTEGRGWSGYTWNESLFPDHVRFLDEVHQRGLKVTLNLHPAEGIQAHEACYPAVAERLGRDWEKHQRVPFDVSDRAFMETYFDCVLSPMEREGVDFWWIDWQQGTGSAIPGVDPLWVLNHYHTVHCEEAGRRPLILSRYCGPGSHRYPVGFSGDTVISWESLRFQPFFTSTASNIGYGWWSHDIGGHAHGVRDPELQVRWLQLGVFSPILRMHSTCNLFNSKEPWRYSAEIEKMMTDALRLRHRLIPYLYTMNWRCHTQGEMLVQPMYYDYPDRDEAYEVPEQYKFGSELMVIPVTSPQIQELELGCARGWLPEGRYYDFFTGLRYEGGRMISVYRPLDRIPVFAKAGAVIPLAEDIDNGTGNPEKMEIVIFAGADGHFDLYEDDGECPVCNEDSCCVTQLDFAWNNGENCRFSLVPGRADEKYMPSARSYHFRFVGLENGHAPVIRICGKAVSSGDSIDISDNHCSVCVKDVPAEAVIEITFEGKSKLTCNNALSWQERVLNNARISYELKEKIYQIITSEQSAAYIYSSLSALRVPIHLIEALMEPAQAASGCQ